jgi:6-phosphogluconolactonase
MTMRTWMGACLALVACGDDSAGHDGGATRDSGAPRDAEGFDAGERDDGGAFDAGLDAGSPPRSRLMYVTVGGANRLAVVELGADGAMTAREDLDLDLPGSPGPMAIARDARRLYVGVNDSIATISLDGDGRPSLDGRTMGTGNPVYLALARGEQVLVSAYFGDDRLKTHDVGGAPPHDELDSEGTPDEPHCAFVAPSGTRVYVPHRNGNRTTWWDVAADGSLERLDELMAEPGVGPRHIHMTPDSAFAYLVNEYDDSVSSHRVRADGSLERFQTVTTLPDDFDGSRNTGADLHVTPDGRSVYSSNRGHDSLAMFSIGEGGMLTPLGQIDTEDTPREFDVSPDGRFVVAAGQGSGQLQSYRVEDDGRLTMLDRLEVGPNLLWVSME